MRTRAGFALIPAAAALALVAGASPSYAVEEPWCIIFGGAQGAVEECSMRTFEMCRQEAIAGNRGSCFPNPRWHESWPQHYRYKSQHKG